ncbi:MAG: DUF3160 domain-containing protein [Acidimicrobiales bacterium]
MPTSTITRAVAAVLASLLLLAACTSSADQADPVSTSSTVPPTSASSTSTSEPAVTPGVATAPFGRLVEIERLTDAATYAGPTHPTSLDGVIVAEWIQQSLADSGAEPLLTANGFVVVPSSISQFHHVYEGAAYDGYPVFVTTDVAYHVWHLAFDKLLRETEQQTLLPVLETLVGGWVNEARAQAEELAGTALEDQAMRVADFYEVAATLLELDVGPIGSRAEAEVALALAADQVAVSPTIGIDTGSELLALKTDYSLFRPRGHYTRNTDLERYFRAMSQLGSNGFLLEPTTLQLGLLASRVVLADPAAAADWQTIYQATAFLVGAADDYTPFEATSAVDAVVDSGWDDPMAFADDATVQRIGEALASSSPVAINPEAASLRVMGTRFVIDSYVLDQLVAPNVAGRETASPLDLAAAFGSTWARDQLDRTGSTDFAGYDEQLGAMQELVASRSIEDWGRTVYDAWHYAIEPSWLPHGGAFPDFMQSEAWTAKAHQSGFGSYTELKHDTILYAKQAVAEGGGDEPPVPPRHWVEPDPVVFRRLGALADLMASGLDQRGLLPTNQGALLADLSDLYAWLGQIAEDELAGLPISDADNDQLAAIGAVLEGFWIRTSDSDHDIDDGPDNRSALVADIMRNASGVLELGTGDVDQIFVLVANDEGAFQVAVGGVYSYHEFWSPTRLTDEEWRAMLDNGSAPERPTWQASFLAD